MDGYPFGLRIGSIKANQNLIRGNSSYTIQTNSGVGESVHETQVIQYSANTQINEGNIEKIMTSDNVSDEVKTTFIEKYLAEQEAPELLPASTNSPSSVTASSDDPRMHKRQSSSNDTSFSFKSIIMRAIDSTIRFLMMSIVGNMISVLLAISIVYLMIKMIYKVFKKVFIAIFRQ